LADVGIVADFWRVGTSRRARAPRRGTPRHAAGKRVCVVAPRGRRRNAKKAALQRAGVAQAHARKRRGLPSLPAR
jgi:hypothetical protein